MKKIIQFNSWLLLYLTALGIFSASSLAGSLDYWKFNAEQSRLEIITDDDVLPQAQLIGNPTRLVIDLPGIILEEIGTIEEISHFIKEVRVRQFNPQTTRLVIELAPDYSIRPGEVKIRSLAPNRWFIQLPKFQSLADYSPPADSSIAIAVPEPNPYPKSRLIIVIDPGHGGQDPGAIGINDIQEKNIILSISLRVAKILEKRGFQVVMTRSDDRFISLKGRVVLAENVNANAFLSIHANSMGLGQEEVNGLETYYFDTGKALAETIHRNILHRINIQDRGVRRARFYVLRKSSMPSSLVEVGFVTGNLDSKRLANANYRQQMAEAIADGIVDYFR